MALINQTNMYLDPSLIGAEQSIMYFPVYDTVTQGTSGNDQLTGDAQNNAIYGNDGDDVLVGLAGNDYLDGGNGNDTLSGGDGNDSLSGGGGNDFLIGGNGNDAMNGGDGNDQLFGGNGNDSLNGGAGNDLMSGGAGADKMDGGVGNHDVVDYSASSTGVTIHLDTGTGAGGDAQGDTYKNVEDVTGSSHNDIIDGTTGDNVIYGGAGNDQIHGNGGYDILHGGDGNDTITAFGTWNTGGAQIFGENGNDHLVGGDDDDQINGGAGDDFIHSGGGVDTLTGGIGADTFEFQKNQPVNGGGVHPLDVITDFNKSEDILSLFDTYMGSGKNTAVNVGSNASGDVQLTFGNTTVVLEGVHNNNYHSVQDLTNAGFNVQDTHW